MERTCVRCSETFEGAHNALRCPDCRIEHNKERRRVPHPDRPCERCGKMFTPYSDGQKYCDPTTCGIEAHRDKARPAESRDEQMDKLFRYYKSRDSIEVTARPDGTRVLSLSDTQFPFVDEPLLDAVLTFVADWKPNDIILNGDILDCYEISDFDKRPERLFNLQDEMEMGRDLIIRLKRYAAKDCKVYWVDGNHEQRLQRIIWKRAQEFAFLVPDLPEAMKLDELCEAYVPYGKHVDYLGFVFTHGNFVSQYSAYTAKRHYDRYRSSGNNGHTHRLGWYFATDMHSRTHSWQENGCLCRTDLDYVKGVANWQPGFTWGVVFKNAYHPQLAPLINYGDGTRGFFAGGKHYEIKG